MKKLIALFALLFIATTSYSQIGFTKSEIIKENKNSTVEKTDNGTDYISYSVEYETYTQLVACYLTDKKDDKEQFCYQVLFIEPASETNNWIKFFNDENFVKLEGMTWKDYEHSIVYDVEVKEGNCLVRKYFDQKL